MSAPHEGDLFDELPILGEIGTELDRILAASEDHAPLRRAWRALVAWRGPRVLALAGVIAVAGTGVALAASGVLFGSPVKPTGPLVATAGEGIPLPGGSRLLPLRVPDPAGGLPWGLRIVRTTRSELCVQIGRVEDGELGELGIDGAFGNDGRFHPLPPDNLAALSSTCAAPGETYSDLATNLDASGAGVRPLAAHVDTAKLRLISFGLLGPDATSLTYTTEATTRTLTPLPGIGAYLIVQPYSASVARTDGTCATCVGGIGGTVGDSLPYPNTSPAAPDGAVRSITYRFGGRTCVDGAWRSPLASNVHEGSNPTLRFRRSCGLSTGPLPAGPPLPNLRTPLTLHLTRHGDLITAALITFPSPLAITNASQSYSATVRLGSADFGYQRGDTTLTDTNYRRGATVSIPIEGLLASVPSRSVTIEVEYYDYIPGNPNQYGTLGTITIHEPAGTHPEPALHHRSPLQISQRTMLLGLSVPDPVGGPPWGVGILLRQERLPAAPRFDRLTASIEIGRVVNHTLGLLGVAGAFNNDDRLHPGSASNNLINPLGAGQVGGSFEHPHLSALTNWDLTIPGAVNAEPYCAFCTNSQLRTFVAGYVGNGANSVTLNGEGAHQTEQLAARDDGIYLFVLKGRWNRQMHFTITARCANGKLKSGPANSHGGTGKPFCPA